MSSRWYPIYQKGNPQLRVFLPNFWMKLIKPTHKQPPNIVQFHCCMQMTKHDIKNYLEKIYNINIIEIRTRIALGETKKDRSQKYIIKEDDRKLAYVVLPKDESFVYPEIFKDAKKDVEKESISQAKQDLQQFVNSNTTPGMPAWFRI